MIIVVEYLPCCFTVNILPLFNLISKNNKLLFLNIETEILSLFFAYPFFQVQKFSPLIWLFFLFL